jgi:hypothetical protein
MSSRKSASGPNSMLTGFVALGQTVLPPGSAGNAGTATGIAQMFVPPRGTAVTRIDPRKLSTNDVVTASPRGTVPLGTSQIALSYGRISSVGTASAVVELTFTNPSTASATLVANTWNLAIQLQGADL